MGEFFPPIFRRLISVYLYAVFVYLPHYRRRDKKSTENNSILTNKNYNWLIMSITAATVTVKKWYTQISKLLNGISQKEKELIWFLWKHKRRSISDDKHLWWRTSALDQTLQRCPTLSFFHFDNSSSVRVRTV